MNVTENIDVQQVIAEAIASANTELKKLNNTDNQGGKSKTRNKNDVDSE